MSGLDQTVELFCGSKPFSKVASALGYATFTVDRDASLNPDLVASVGQIQPGKIPAAPLIVWAAPPGNPVFHSKANWEADGSFYPRNEDAEQALNLFRETVGLITQLKPTWWFIENPKSLLRKMPVVAGFNRGYPSRTRQTLNHGDYGGSRKQQSDIWTNAYWWTPKPMDSEDETKPHGGQGFTADPADASSRLPPYAYAEMLDHFDRYRRWKDAEAGR
jgi:hypothetical protein